MKIDHLSVSLKHEQFFPLLCYTKFLVLGAEANKKLTLKKQTGKPLWFARFSRKPFSNDDAEVLL